MKIDILFDVIGNKNCHSFCIYDYVTDTFVAIITGTIGYWVFPAT